jgi:hypothetical protein
MEGPIAVKQARSDPESAHHRSAAGMEEGREGSEESLGGLRAAIGVEVERLI